MLEERCWDFVGLIRVESSVRDVVRDVQLSAVLIALFMIAKLSPLHMSPSAGPVVLANSTIRLYWVVSLTVTVHARVEVQL